jgi:hypothetical protein
MTRPWWLPGSQLVIMAGFVGVIAVALAWRAITLAVPGG